MVMPFRDAVKTPIRSLDVLQIDRTHLFFRCAKFILYFRWRRRYKGKKVLVIVKEGVVWFKGNDVARLLEFQDMHQNITHKRPRSRQNDFHYFRGMYKYIP